MRFRKMTKARNLQLNKGGEEEGTKGDRSSDGEGSGDAEGDAGGVRLGGVLASNADGGGDFHVGKGRPTGARNRAHRAGGRRVHRSAHCRAVHRSARGRPGEEVHRLGHNGVATVVAVSTRWEASSRWSGGGHATRQHRGQLSDGKVFAGCSLNVFDEGRHAEGRVGGVLGTEQVPRSRVVRDNSR